LRRLTPDDARHYVAIVGAGPAGLRTAELLVALNRQVSEAERRKILLFDRNPVPAGLGVYGIPPVKKQGVLKDGIVQQAQGVMHGMVGKREWGAFSRDRFVQVIDSAFVRFFPYTDVGTDITIEQIEQLGIPLVIATGAQQPRLPTDTQGTAVPGRDLGGIVSATSEFFRQIGTAWLQEQKGVLGLTYDRQPHTLRGKKVIMVYGGGNVASDAFMWAFRNTPPGTDVILIYRGELHAMTNMSRPYYKPIDEALRLRRAVSPLLTAADVLDATALLARLKERQEVIDTLVLQRLPGALQGLHPVSMQILVQAFNAVLQMPDLVRRLPGLEPGSFRVDLQPVWTQVMQDGSESRRSPYGPWLELNRALLEMAYVNEIRRLHRASMFGLLTVEAYLDHHGQGQLTHVLLRQHRRGEIMRDRKTSQPLLLRSGVIERDNIMRHRVTKEKLYRWSTVPTDTYIELAVDLAIEAIGDVVQPLGQIEMTSWQTFKADLNTGRVPGKTLWVAGQALTQKGKVRDSYVSALNTVMDMGPLLYPQAWDRQQLWHILAPGLYAPTEASTIY
jgi:Pyridine nucleotide-disulphide oxidoreductase